MLLLQGVRSRNTHQGNLLCCRTFHSIPEHFYESCNLRTCNLNSFTLYSSFLFSFSIILCENLMVSNDGTKYLSSRLLYWKKFLIFYLILMVLKNFLQFFLSCFWDCFFVGDDGKCHCCFSIILRTHWLLRSLLNGRKSCMMLFLRFKLKHGNPKKLKLQERRIYNKRWNLNAYNLICHFKNSSAPYPIDILKADAFSSRELLKNVLILYKFWESYQPQKWVKTIEFQSWEMNKIKLYTTLSWSCSV